MGKEEVDADAASDVGLIAPKPPVKVCFEVTPEIMVVITITVWLAGPVGLFERGGGSAVRPDGAVLTTPRGSVEVSTEITEVTVKTLSLMKVISFDVGDAEAEGLIAPEPPVELTL